MVKLSKRILTGMLLGASLFGGAANAQSTQPSKVVYATSATSDAGARTAKTDLYLTNHDTADQSVTTCYQNNCTTETVKPGASVVLEDVLATKLGAPKGTGMLNVTAAKPDKLDCRAITYEDGKQSTNACTATSDLVTAGKSATLFGPGRYTIGTLGLVATENSTATLALKNKLGVTLADKRVNLTANQPLEQHYFDFFGAPAQEETHVDISTQSGTVAAYVRIKDNDSRVVSTNMAQRHDLASTVGYIPYGLSYDINWPLSDGSTVRHRANTALQMKNITNTPDAMTIANLENPSQINYHSIVAAEAPTLDDAVNFVGKRGYAPLRLSTKAGVIATARTTAATTYANERTRVPMDMAVPIITEGQTAFGKSGGLNRDQDATGILTFNGIKDDPNNFTVLHLHNVSRSDTNAAPQAAKGTVELYDSAGKLQGTRPFNLEQNANYFTWPSDMAGAPVANGSIKIKVDNEAFTGSNTQPRVMAYVHTFNGNHLMHAGNQIVTEPSNKVTGEQYVNSWFGDKQFFLNNKEVKCMINGNCGTRSYAKDLAQALYSTSRYPGNVDAFETFIRQTSDGVIASGNGELFPNEDPLQVTATFNTYRVGQGATVKIDMNSTNSSTVIGLYRDFLVNYVAAHPEEYGGSQTTGPNLSADPTWNAVNRNDPTTGLTLK